MKHVVVVDVVYDAVAVCCVSAFLGERICVMWFGVALVVSGLLLILDTFLSLYIFHPSFYVISLLARRVCVTSISCLA